MATFLQKIGKKLGADSDVLARAQAAAKIDAMYGRTKSHYLYALHGLALVEVDKNKLKHFRFPGSS